VAPTLAALQAGAHVYLEKPLGITVEDCLRIVAADQAAGGRVMVGFNLRFAPLYARLHGLMGERRIGRPLTLQADEFYHGGRTYFRRWNRFRNRGGGLWVTKACHDFDVLQWLAGAAPVRISASARLTYFTSKPEGGKRCSECAIESTCPETGLPAVRDAATDPVSARIAELRERAGLHADLCLFNSEKDTFDHGVAQVEFANEAIGVYTLNVVSPITDRRIRINGTTGTLQGALEETEILHWDRSRVPTGDALQRIPFSGDGLATHGGGDAHLLDEFAAFMAGRPSRAVRPAEAAVSVAMSLAATRASDEHRTIAMAELPGWREIQNAAAYSWTQMSR
jgi:predicted dehydrogenase